MHNALSTAMRLQVTIPAAAYGPSAAVPDAIGLSYRLIGIVLSLGFCSGSGEGDHNMVGAEAIWGVHDSQFAATLKLAMCALQALTKFGGSAATMMLTWMMLVRGHKGFGREQEGGGGKCPWWWCQ